LHLQKSLYGIRLAPRLWFQKLLTALLDDGFTQSAHDQCLLFKKDMIIFLWVDDCGIVAPTMDLVDAFIKRLKDQGFELTKDIDLSEYLGINFSRDSSNGSINMTQPGLIKKILAATGMQDCSVNKTPTSSNALGSDPDGEPMEEDWSYRSIIGMLLYLSTNTRPDIAYTVSQVARFSANPKQIHARAVKQILRYLKGTINQGTLFKPSSLLKLHCYGDADFAGLHGFEHQDDPISVRSCTGYVIFFGGCPLV
jgi:hypothetical protein